MNENDINRALLIILDGVGVGPSSENNGWALAHTPNIDLLLNDYPSTTCLLYTSPSPRDS